MFFMCAVILLTGLLLVFSQKLHIFSVFICLEFVTLSVLLMVGVMSVQSVSVISVFLCVGTCEASLCLSLVVMMVRLYGNDKVSNFCYL